MRLLFCIPHFYRHQPSKVTGHSSMRVVPEVRIQALTSCLTSLRQLFGRPQCLIDHARRTTLPANQLTAERLDIVVCTAGTNHLLDTLCLDADYYTHRPTRADARLLGFECHSVLRERIGQYDYYCYLEDDLILRDPWFFVKLAWFTSQFGDDALLAPNRYELTQNQVVHKAYIDGPLRPEITSPFQDVTDTPQLSAQALGVQVDFHRPLNPHAGAFFLNARQMAHWASSEHSVKQDVRFIGPLESAATLGVMRTFRIYKPAPTNAGFLEIEHFGREYVGQIRRGHADSSTTRQMGESHEFIPTPKSC